MTATDQRPGEAAPAAPPAALMRVIRGIDAFADVTGWICAWLIVPLIGVMVLTVFSRYVLGSTFIWVTDVTYMLYGTLFMLGAGYTLRHGGHIRTDFLYNNFSARWQGFVDTVAYLVFFFPVLSVFFWFGMENFLEAWRLQERAITSPWMPYIYPFRGVIPLAAALLLVQGVSEVLKSGYAMVKGTWP